MIHLAVDNSVCKLSGYTAEQFADLRELLSYQADPQAAFFSGRGHRSSKRFLFTKRGEFPTGLLYLVWQYLQAAELPYAEEDHRKRPKASPSDFKASFAVTPYPEQENAANACLKAGRGIVAASTGVGKSLIAALIIQKVAVPTLVVVPSLELKRQLTESLKSVFGAGKVGKDKPIRVENVDAVNGVMTWGNEVKRGYDCLIIDEFHHSGAKTYRALNQKAWGGIYFKFGLTATPFRSQDHERLLLESVLSEVVYRVEYKTAVDKGYIVPLEAYYYTLPKRMVEGDTWAEVYKELVVENEERNSLIANLLATLLEGGFPTLTLVKEIAHGEAIQAMTGIPFANGLAEDTKELIADFNAGKIKSLIGTVGVLGEGVDTRPAEYVVIAGLGKSKNAFMQNCGRGFRRHGGKESCKVILFNDRSHEWTKAHFNEQKKILLAEYGVIPVELER